MNSPAINPLVLADACQQMLVRSAREYRRDSELLIGRVMHPKGLQRLFKRPCSRAQALAKLDRPGSPLATLTDAYLANNLALSYAKSSALRLSLTNDIVYASPRAYALVANELRKYENPFVLVD